MYCWSIMYTNSVRTCRALHVQDGGLECPQALHSVGPFASIEGLYAGTTACKNIKDTHYRYNRNVIGISHGKTRVFTTDLEHCLSFSIRHAQFVLNYFLKYSQNRTKSDFSRLCSSANTLNMTEITARYDLVTTINSYAHVIANNSSVRLKCWQKFQNCIFESFHF